MRDLERETKVEYLFLWLRSHVKTTTQWNSSDDLNSLHTNWAFEGTERKSHQAKYIYRLINNPSSFADA